MPASKSGKKQKFALGIVDAHMGAAIFEDTGITASYNEVIVELIRGIRTHFAKIIKSESFLKKQKLTLHYIGVKVFLFSYLHFVKTVL